MNQATTTGAAGTVSRPSSFRWMQLVLGIVAMAMIANLQYGLDVVRRSNRCKTRLESRCDSSRIHDFRSDRNMVGTYRRLVRQ